MLGKRLMTVIAVIAVLACSAATVYAKNIPDYYSAFIGSKTHKNWGFEFNSENMIHLPKGDTYKMSEKMPDGSVKRFYYVSDGNNIMRLSDPNGEVITETELKDYFANTPKNQENANTTKMDIQANEKPQAVKVVLNDVREKDLEIWNDENYELSEYELEVARLINIERVKAGVEPLTINTDVSKVARIRAMEYVEINKLPPTHELPFYGLPSNTMKLFGLKKGAGENCTKTMGAAQAVQNWMNSEGHRKNMLDPKYKEMGVGFKGFFEPEDIIDGMVEGTLEYGMWSLLLTK